MRAARWGLAAVMLAGGTMAQAAPQDCAKALTPSIAFPATVRITAAERVPAAAAGTRRPDPNAPPHLR